MKKHIRRIISVIITSLLLCGCISQVEESSTFAMEIEGSDTYNDFYYVVNGDEVAITDYYGNDENVSIPEMIEGKTVTSIKDNTFMNCIGIKTVNIPSSIKNIDKDIFSGCYNLSNINVDNNNNNYSSVNGILFDDVNKTIIRYPQGRSGDEYEVPNGTKKIGYSAFEDCKNLSSIIIPNSVVSIDDLAFAHCTNLTWNRIPDSVTSIGKFAFYNCCNLEAINIPAQVKNIEEYTFYYCSKIEDINISSNILSIDKNAFSYCSSLCSINVDSTNKKYYSINGVLFDKINKSIVKYPEGKTDEEFLIPYGLTSIGEGAFKNNKNLKSIFIYSTLQAIGNQAFENCEELTRVSNSAFDTCCNIKSIGDSAFEGCSSLTSIMISDNAKSIGREAFYNCDSLTTMVIPYSVTSIGYDAFHKCNKDFTIKGYYDSFAEKYARDNNINFKSIPIETLKNNSIINSQVITLGNKIIIKGQGAGGIAPYRYSYYYKNAKDKSWVKIKDYSTAETIEFTPKVAGNYYIGVGVKDQSGKVVNKTIKLVVKPQALKNTSVVNSVSVKLGNSIKIKGAGSGGTAPYKYCYLYKTSKDKSWTKLKDYSTTQIVEFTPKTSGEYYVGISVKDNNANIVNKTIKITVYK